MNVEWVGYDEPGAVKVMGTKVVGTNGKPNDESAPRLLPHDEVCFDCRPPEHWYISSCGEISGGMLDKGQDVCPCLRLVSESEVE
jgi:hypothetical protein